MIRVHLRFASVLAHVSAPARLVLALVFLPTLLAWATLWVYVEGHQERVFPGVRVLGKPVGGLTVEEVRVAVHTVVAEKLASEIVLSHGEETWKRGVEAFGIEVDGDSIAATVSMTGITGHTATGRQWLTDQLRLMTVGVEVPVRFRLDRNRARASLETIGRVLERSPVNAEVFVGASGEPGDVHLVESKVGQTLNFEETLNRLEASPTLI